MSNVYTQQALINLLEAKGIMKKAELLEEIKRVRNKKVKPCFPSLPWSKLTPDPKPLQWGLFCFGKCDIERKSTIPNLLAGRAS